MTVISINTLWEQYPTPEHLPPVVVEDTSLPLVSVVTPSYNQGQFIRDTIDSVLTQNYPNIEYWVIDGGSTDETIAILKEYEYDPRFHWISEPDSGQSDAINKGWSRCRGEVLAWLNSDDTYLPDAIRVQVNALLTHKTCGGVYGDGIFVDQNGKHLYKCYGLPYRVIELLRITIPLQPTVFIKRHLCEKVGPLNQNFKYSMDSEYWIRLSRLTDFWYEPQLIATYRLHQSSKTVADYSGFYKDWLTIADQFFADPCLPNQYKNCKREVYAGIYSRIAGIEAENGSIQEMIKYLLKSVAMNGIRPRLFKSFFVLIDRFIPVKITPKLIEAWTKIRTK